MSYQQLNITCMTWYLFRELYRFCSQSFAWCCLHLAYPEWKLHHNMYSELLVYRVEVVVRVVVRERNITAHTILLHLLCLNKFSYYYNRTISHPICHPTLLCCMEAVYADSKDNVLCHESINQWQNNGPFNGLPILNVLLGCV